MNWSVVGPAVFSLIGVTLGTSGTLIGQYLTTRTTKAQALAERRTALRAERKTAILEFMETAKQVERFIEQRVHSGERPEGSVELTNRMWFLQQCVDLVSTAPVRNTVTDYAEGLHSLLYQELPTERHVWALMSEKRQPFVDSARVELGTATKELGTPERP
ncbi:hypothetical protein AGRA3207_007395 [Actinomadura graeca]|uniref:Secreted protein n=1 Tax=Actinomadura graeca TaxID=2750812 RepID=A0ABX8R5Z4_9ACTN|nr:hypothetical protein [Actinomadura graeca]QXJ25834.1 hypothetical protein AGRA3207_007395 [Actinomadura graeca]